MYTYIRWLGLLHLSQCHWQWSWTSLFRPSWSTHWISVWNSYEAHKDILMVVSFSISGPQRANPMTEARYNCGYGPELCLGPSTLSDSNILFSIKKQVLSLLCNFLWCDYVWLIAILIWTFWPHSMLSEVGSNNINLFVPSGQFGTRLQGGKDAWLCRGAGNTRVPVLKLAIPWHHYLVCPRSFPCSTAG